MTKLGGGSGKPGFLDDAAKAEERGTSGTSGVAARDVWALRVPEAYDGGRSYCLDVASNGRKTTGTELWVAEGGRLAEVDSVFPWGDDVT